MAMVVRDNSVLCVCFVLSTWSDLFLYADIPLFRSFLLGFCGVGRNGPHLCLAVSNMYNIPRMTAI